MKWKLNWAENFLFGNWNMLKPADYLVDLKNQIPKWYETWIELRTFYLATEIV